jgi:class 3 adenylate cyclase
VPERSETEYADTPLGRIAYQRIGHGPIDVLVHTPIYLPVDLIWEEPALVRVLERLSSFCSHIWFDPRGRGASDPVPHAEGRYMDSIVDDMVAVLDALECERAAVLDFGSSAGFLFAATHPERTTALAHFHPTALLWPVEEQPADIGQDIARRVARIEREWGVATHAHSLTPGLREDAQALRWLARSERLSCSPAEAAWRVRNVYLTDLRDVLRAVRVPTLVVAGTRRRAARESRFIVDHIEGSRLVEVPSEELVIFMSAAEPMLDAIEEFLTGRLPTTNTDRVLATVMFTDVVGSTEQADRLGDQRWRQLLARHDALVRGALDRFRGREVKSMGDGFVATFDTPGRAIRCACALRDQVRSLGIELRVGLHTGEIELVDTDIGGIAVHIAQRVSACARPGDVMVSATVRDLVAGSGLEFEDRGEHQLKGLPDTRHLFAVVV